MSLQIKIDSDAVAAFCKKWKVGRMAFFGSVLRDDFGPSSDVDVLLKLQQPSAVGLEGWTRMEAELEALFGRKVDLVAAEGVRNPFIRDEIRRTRQVVYEQAA